MPPPNTLHDPLEILDHLPQGVFVLRPDWTICHWNQCLEEWTGISRHTILGKAIGTHFPHLSIFKYTSRIDPLFQGGPPATFASQFHPQFLPCFLPNGKPRVQHTIAKTLWQESAQEWHALIIIQDISDLHRQVCESQRLRKQTQTEMAERQEIQRALQDSETRLELAVNGANDGIWDWMDVTKDEEWWSPLFYELLGFKPGEIPATLSTFTNLLHPDDRPGTFTAIENHLQQNHPFNIDYRLRTKSGEYKWFRARGTAIRDEVGRPIRMAGSIQDITHAREQEQELRTLSDRLILATASAGMGIWDWDIVSNVLSWDTKMMELYGIQPSKFLGAYEAWTKGLHPEDRAQAEQDLQMAQEGKRDFHTEFRVVWPDQTVHVMAARGLVQRDNQGNPIRMIGVNWDITKDKSAEEAQRHLKRAIDQGREGLALLDQKGHYTYINPAHAKMYGYETAALLGGSWKQLYSHTTLGYIEKRCFPILHSKGHWQGELLGLRKDGSEFPVEIALSLLTNGKQQPSSIVCTCRDITERKKIEDVIKQGETNNRLIIDAAPNGMVMIDKKGIIVLANETLMQQFGFARDELLGHPIERLLPQRFRAQHPTHRETFFTSPEPRSMGSGRELYGQRKDKSEFPVEIGLNPLTTPQGIFVLASIIDITERKKANEIILETTKALEQKNQELVEARDKALEAARSKSEFLATMSHEIRTPLNGVIGMTGLLIDTELDRDQRDMVTTIEHSGDFLLTVINDILDFSKIDAGKLDLEMIDFDLRTTVDDVLAILAERASCKGLNLTALVYASTPTSLRGDPGRIRQILFNLVGNAIKFTDHGEVILDVSVQEKRDNLILIKFIVRDTGIGLTPESQHRLFESFSQGDSSTTRKFGGTGLGLAICKRLVNLMEGEIGIASVPGQGSEFWFTVPFSQQLGPQPSPNPFPTLHNRRLCIVESHDTTRFLLHHYAQSWGMECEVAQTSREGLALLQKRMKEGHPFDVAILDQTMCETIQEDGLSLGHTIRNTHSLAGTPLILLTSLGRRGEARLAREAGFNGYLTKPVTQVQLSECLRMVLGEEYPTPGSEHPHPSSFITRHTVEEAQDRSKIRILLAEDNVVNQKVAVRMLEKLGLRVDLAVNGLKAVEAMQRISYDLVFMDCQMPEMDGFEATKKIRETEEEKHKAKEKFSPDALPLTSNHVPIIALTANALQGDREKCLLAGMDDFLSKPIRLEKFEAVIKKWIPADKKSTVPNGGHEKSQSQQTTFSIPYSAIAHDIPALDEKIVQELRDLGGDEDPEFAQSILDQFLEDLPRHVKSIQQALEDQDAENLMKAAHSCKGSARYIGALPLAEICLTLENLGRTGKTDGGMDVLAQLQGERERLLSALNSLAQTP